MDWPYRPPFPQRYSVNYPQYRRLGGSLDPETLAAGFTARGENHDDMARFFSFCLIFDQIVKEGLVGDFAELGVYKGNTATVLAAMARELGRTAYLLDTFEGFPQADLHGVDAGVAAGAFNDTSLDSVRALVGEANVQYIKGYFPDTSAHLPEDGAYCLAHIDCDLFAPIHSGLEYFYPRMAPGGFIVVHDYSSLHWGGAEKAVDEFFADKIEAPAPLPDSGGSVVVRKAKSGDPSENWLLRKRAGLLGPHWTATANGALSELLGGGWSAPEDWGIWGVGPAHALHVPLPQPGVRSFEVQLDVHAALVGARTTQEIEIWLGNGPITRWHFTESENRGVRSLKFQLDPAVERRGFVMLTFRPRSSEPPSELSPEITDSRPLGMALHRIRLVVE